MNKLLDHALNYSKQGFSVIPVCTPLTKETCIQHGECKEAGKRPLVQWAEIQKRRADETEIRTWWQKWPDANIGGV